ncbi:MAG: DUF3887 domain-containing protein [Dehalococcoidales bacterium]|nr:DUF3887 domain-containing protein [Dehalococcoidales bacterium]
MSKSMVKVACGVLIMLITIAGASACATEMAEPDYANQIVESALQGMSDGDYAKFTEYFSPAAQSAMDETTFDEASQLIKSLIGDYIDKEFWKAEEDGEYTIVYYKANFSQEPADVIVTVYFEEIDGEMYISGFLLDSPKLRGE